MSSATSSVPVRRSLVARVLIACGVTLLVASVLWLFLEVLLVASIWPAPESPPRQGEAVLASSIDSGSPTHSPAALARVVREPVNAWSCVAFVFVAGFAFAGARDAFGRWFSVTIAIAGVAALLYHASATREFRQADVAGLYWACGLVSVLGALRLGVLPARAGAGVPAFVLWVIGGALALLATTFRNVHVAGFKPLAVPVVTTVIALLVGSMLLVYCLRQSDARKWRLGLGSMVLMAVGFALEAGDHPGGPWSWPGGMVQPHALWHLLCAVSLGLAMECFESPARAMEGRVVPEDSAAA